MKHANIVKNTCNWEKIGTKFPRFSYVPLYWVIIDGIGEFSNSLPL
jgi:hypothetical protein